MSRSGYLKKVLAEKGASLVGFADLHEMEERPFEKMPQAISIAVALNPEIVLDIRQGPTVGYCGEYERVNRILEVLAGCAVHLIRTFGYRADTLSPTDRKYVEGMFLTSPFSHKRAATTAGLGWIGKSDLLVTKEYGSAIRLNTVFTDMPLPCGKPVERSFCGSCDACVRACPAGAPLNVAWNAGVHRDKIMDIHACYSCANDLSRKIAVKPIICGICIAACPWTKKYVNSMVPG